jgi:cell pole-organizing protein PopZ
MTQAARKEEPSMEEILASIRRMIAEDEQESPPSPAATSQPLGAAPATQDDSMPSERVASPAPSSGTGPEWSPSEASAAGQGARSDGLLSPATAAALDAAFNTLAQTAQPRRGRTVEELVSELMRPMLKTWLDENLPAIVERLVRAEIERISRARD